MQIAFGAKSVEEMPNVCLVEMGQTKYGREGQNKGGSVVSPQRWLCRRPWGFVRTKRAEFLWSWGMVPYPKGDFWFGGSAHKSPEIYSCFCLKCPSQRHSEGISSKLVTLFSIVTSDIELGETSTKWYKIVFY